MSESLQERITKKFFIVKTLFLLLFIFNSCDDSNRNGGKENAVSDTTKRMIAQDTTVTPGTTANHSDSFLNTLRKAQKVYVGDFDIMRTRSIIRILVPYSRTLFFNDKGKERGFSADYCRDFENFLNKKYHKQLHSIPFTIAFIPTPRDQLISHVIQGLGDFAAGNLTETEERLRQVDFFAPLEVRVSEIVLNRKQDAPIANVDQLSGRTIHVRQSSSYFQSLQALNKTLAAKGKMPVKVNIMSENLEDEDLMEMLDAGIIPVIIVDDWKAKMWAQILPNIRLNENVAVRTGGQIGWAYRKNSPLLTAEFNDFYSHYEKQLGVVSYRFKKYGQQVKELQDPTKSDNVKHYKEIIQLFEKYGKQYDFDPLMLAAQGFQESELNQNERSAVGAIGIMQVMPETGRSMKVGNITVTEPNIHAGTKYMHIIMTNYFHDAHFDNFNKSLFAFASYNAGPGRIEGLRKIAADRGLNPDVWLNNVEIIASEKIGIETTTYVRNIVKYYYSYKLMAELSEEQRKQKKAF